MQLVLAKVQTGIQYGHGCAHAGSSESVGSLNTCVPWHVVNGQEHGSLRPPAPECWFPLVVHLMQKVNQRN